MRSEEVESKKLCFKGLQRNGVMTTEVYGTKGEGFFVRWEIIEHVCW